MTELHPIRCHKLRIWSYGSVLNLDIAVTHGHIVALESFRSVVAWDMQLVMNHMCDVCAKILDGQTSPS